VDNQANLSASNLKPPKGSNGWIGGDLNGGKAKVELSSFDGTINIHRREQ
jgi:hypothetical protein